METNWAAENLQTIRTLMERSAIYRRALAPIMIYCGVLGGAAGAVGWFLKMEEPRQFTLFWGGVAVAALTGSFLLVRRQALKDSEPVWSPPTRRVVAAMMPALFFGAFLGILFWSTEKGLPGAVLPPLWMALYGCSLHAAGFFMPRGIRLLGWAFIIIACGKSCQLFADVFFPSNSTPVISGHLSMGLSFGLLHFAYGIYLYFTEKRRNES